MTVGVALLGFCVCVCARAWCACVCVCVALALAMLLPRGHCECGLCSFCSSACPHVTGRVAPLGFCVCARVCVCVCFVLVCLFVCACAFYLYHVLALRMPILIMFFTSS